MYKFYKGAFMMLPTKNKRERHIQLVYLQQRWKKEYTHYNQLKWHKSWRKVLSSNTGEEKTKLYTHLKLMMLICD